jgi:PAS domain S-box-containing protein
MRQEKSEYGIKVVNEEIDQLLESIQQVPYLISPFGQEQIISFDKGIVKITGYSADDILADKQLWLNMIHPADRQRVFGVFGYCKSRGIPFEIEYRFIHKNGSLRWVVDEGEPVFSEEAGIVQIEGIITDVSEFKKVWTRHLPSVPELRDHAMKAEKSMPFGCGFSTAEARLDKN